MPPETEAEVETTPDQALEATIRETYQKLTAEPDNAESDIATGQPPAAEQDATSGAQPSVSGDRARGPDGKFVSKGGDAGTATPVAAGSTQAPQASPHDAYPSSWKKDHEAQWKALPEAVRAEVHRREQDFLNGIKEYKEPAAFGRALGQDLFPHLETFRRLNVTPQQVVREVMGTWSTLVNGTSDQKRQTLLQVAKNYGIDLPAGGVPSPQNGAQPPANGVDFSPVLQRVESLEQTLQAQRSEALRLEQERVDSEIASFGKDPKHEHFEAVRQEMGRLIQSGSADTLQTAYDKAVWALPETRAKLMAVEAENLRKRQAEEAAAARKAASANVTRRGTPPAVQKPGSMDDTIRAEYRRLTAAE